MMFTDHNSYDVPRSLEYTTTTFLLCVTFPRGLSDLNLLCPWTSLSSLCLARRHHCIRDDTFG